MSIKAFDYYEMKEIIFVNSKKPNTKLIDRNHYVNNETGEVKELKNPETKMDAFKSFQSEMLKHRRLVLTNCSEELPNVWHVTVSFIENIDTIEKLRPKQAAIMVRFKRNLKDAKYVCFREIQPERQMWHLHLIVWSTSNIEDVVERFKNKIAKGEDVKVDRLRTNKDLNKAAFYLTNYSIHPNMTCEEIKKIEAKRKTLETIPANLELFSSSKNLKKPVFEIYDDDSDIYEQTKMEAKEISASFLKTNHHGNIVPIFSTFSTDEKAA